MLVADAQWGIALQDPEGRRLGILWPFGYSGRRVDRSIVLVDRAQRVLAKVGDQVTVGGGEVEQGWWFACPDVRVLPRG